MGEPGKELCGWESLEGRCLDRRRTDWVGRSDVAGVLKFFWAVLFAYKDCHVGEWTVVKTSLCGWEDWN